MSDPLRTDAASDVQSGAEREAKIEQLLLTGLDHYFDGQYEQAINIWTRALFLDRGHARARAYIERARSALAEQQRESEELLQRGLAAFDRGASDEARRLLEAAITRGAPPDEALSVLDRIHRLDPAQAAADAVDDFRDERPAWIDPPRTSPVVRTLRFGAWLMLAGAVVTGALIVAGVVPLEWPWSRTPPVAPFQSTVQAPVDPALAVVRRGERALARARLFARSGRLHDALASLDQVTMTDEEKGEADRLRGEIQRQLLALGQTASDVSAPLTTTGPNP
jgi:tetratricopeptide (TPR) repeat protein